MATKDHFIIYGPEDYKLYYHMSPEGHIWLDAKNNPIPLNSQLVGHIGSIDPHTYIITCFPITLSQSIHSMQSTLLLNTTKKLPMIMITSLM